VKCKVCGREAATWDEHQRFLVWRGDHPSSSLDEHEPYLRLCWQHIGGDLHCQPTGGWRTAYLAAIACAKNAELERDEWRARRDFQINLSNKYAADLVAERTYGARMRAALASAMREPSDDHMCAECGNPYTLEPEDAEPSALCHSCAQTVLMEAVAALTPPAPESHGLCADAIRLREAIGVMVPTIIRCFIKLREQEVQSAGRDVDLEGSRATLARIEKAMDATAYLEPGKDGGL
jgi:hypothetical protein